MKCKNIKCNNQLSNKQKQFCSQTCHYDWKRNQLSEKHIHNKKVNELKESASILTDRNQIYDFISNNISRFNASNFTESERIIKMIKDYSLKIPDNIETWKELYDYLKKPKRCEICNSESKFDTFTHAYYRFCSVECKHKWRSLNMTGDKNNFHKVTDVVKKRIGKENGERLKRMIKAGTFTPNITNSWASSRCIIILNGIEIKLRSSWEAYFQLHNPTLKYEKLRIPYRYKNDWHNYIIDFIDDDNKIIYEIKPKSESNNTLNVIKRNAAIEWAKSNKYNYIEINDDWFSSNFNGKLIEGQPDTVRLKRLLRQFDENK